MLRVLFFVLLAAALTTAVIWLATPAAYLMFGGVMAVVVFAWQIARREYAPIYVVVLLAVIAGAAWPGMPLILDGIRRRASDDDASSDDPA